MATQTTPNPLAAFTVAAPKRGNVIVSENAPRVSDSLVSESAYVTRGVRLVGRDKSEVPVALLRDGSSESTFPLSSVGALISGGIVSHAEVLALLGVPAEKTPAACKALAEILKAHA